MRPSTYVVGCVSASLFLTSYIGNALTVAVPFVAKRFDALPQIATYIVSAYAIALACFLLPASLLARQYGNKKIYTIGLISCALVSLALPFSPNLWTLIACRGFQGLASALCLSTAMALIAEHLKNNQRYLAIGIAVGCTYAGVSTALSLSGYVVDHFGYEALFYASGVCLSGLSFAAFLLPNADNAKDENTFKSKTAPALPVVKTAVFVSGLILTLASLSALASFSLAKYGLVVGCFLIGLVLILDRIDSKINAQSAGSLNHNPTRQILIPIDLLLTNKAFCFSFLVSVSAYVSVMAEPVLLAMFAQFTLKMSAAQTGLIVVAQPITIAIVSTFTGLLTKRLGGARVVTLGLIIQTIALASFVLLDENSTALDLLIRQLFVGTGFAMFSAPNTTLITLSVKKEHYALASSMQQLGRGIGQSCSYALVTVIISLMTTVKPNDINYPVQFADASVVILAISAFLGLAGVFFSYQSQQAAKAQNEQEETENLKLSAAS